MLPSDSFSKKEIFPRFLGSARRGESRFSCLRFRAPSVLFANTDAAHRYIAVCRKSNFVFAQVLFAFLGSRTRLVARGGTRAISFHIVAPEVKWKRRKANRKLEEHSFASVCMASRAAAVVSLLPRIRREIAVHPLGKQTAECARKNEITETFDVFAVAVRGEAKREFCLCACVLCSFLTLLQNAWLEIALEE